jgi:hypothetical protein
MDLPMIAGQLALISATAFAGASAYINAVEQPARIELDAHALLREWRISYTRGTVMQVSLAVIAIALGSVSFAKDNDWRWLCGTLVLLALLPWTLLCVMPINRRLMSMSALADHERVRSEVQKWGRMHAVRTAIGVAATLIFLWASTGQAT